MSFTIHMYRSVQQSRKHHQLHMNNSTNIISCTVSTNERTAMWKIVQVGNWQELFSVSRPKASATVASAEIVDQITVPMIVKFVQV